MQIAANISATKNNNPLVKKGIVFFVVLLTIETLSFLLFRNDELTGLYIKTLFAIALVYTLVSFLKWSKTDRTSTFIFLLLLLKLIVDSIINYGSVLAYPSVLAVVYPFVYVLFIKNVLKRIKINVLKVFINTITIFYFLFMLVYGRGFDFSLSTIIWDSTGPFSGDTRILHANSILLFVIPYLYYLNQLLKKKTLKNLFLFLLPLFIIVIHQHRTVWVSTIFSTVLFFWLKNRGFKAIKKIVIAALILVSLVVLIFSMTPQISNMFAEKFSDILDPLNTENTAGWRYLQILSYFNLFLQKPIFGWSFEGFLLPNQFMIESSVSEGTGHHFHDAYIEILFYFGITGLLLKYYPLYRIAKLSIKNKLSDNSVILSSFCIAGFLYSFSYVPPLAFWALVGICLYYIETDLTKSSRDNKKLAPVIG